MYFVFRSGHMWIFIPYLDHHVEKRSPPYWPYSTTDFWRYVEYFRSIGDYDRIQQLAHIFYAHFPIGNTMGYDTPEQQEIQIEVAKEAHTE